MTTPTSNSVTIRVLEVAQVGFLLQVGAETVPFGTEPKTRWAITLDDGDVVRVEALFDDKDFAVEAADNLRVRLAALDGPQIATRDGRTLQ